MSNQSSRPETDKRIRCWRTIIATLCFAAIVPGCQKETTSVPQVNGKTLQQWADVAAAPLEPDRLADVHQRELRARKQRRQALANIEEIGAQAIPVLMELSQTGDRELRSDARRILSRIGKRISPEAESVIPLLASVHQHSASVKSKQWAEAVLRDIGAGSAPVDAMMKPLSDHALRSEVVVGLAKSDWWINGMNVSTKPIDALRDIATSSAVKVSSVEAYDDLAKLHEQISNVKLHVIENVETQRLPPVAELIQQAEQPQSRMFALQSLQHYAEAGAAVPGIDLGGLTPDLSAAVPVLIKVTESRNQRYTPQSLKILGLIGPDASAAVPVAIDLLQSDLYDSQAEAAAALGGFGVGSREVIEALIASLDHDPTTNKRFAGRPRPGSRRGRGLRSQLPPGTLRANVAVALGKLHAHPDLSVPALVKMLDLQYMGSSEGCDFAATALAEFGTDAKPAIPDLVDKR